jgi:hypothetical protein
VAVVTGAWLCLVLLVMGLALGIGCALAWGAYDTAQYDRTQRNVRVRLEAEAAAERLTRAAQSVCDVMTTVARTSRGVR